MPGQNQTRASAPGPGALTATEAIRPQQLTPLPVAPRENGWAQAAQVLLQGASAVGSIGTAIGDMNDRERILENRRLAEVDRVRRNGEAQSVEDYGLLESQMLVQTNVDGVLDYDSRLKFYDDAAKTAATPTVKIHAQTEIDRVRTAQASDQQYRLRQQVAAEGTQRSSAHALVNGWSTDVGAAIKPDGLLWASLSSLDSPQQVEGAIRLNLMRYGEAVNPKKVDWNDPFVKDAMDSKVKEMAYGFRNSLSIETGKQTVAMTTAAREGLEKSDTLPLSDKIDTMVQVLQNPLLKENEKKPQMDSLVSSGLTMLTSGVLSGRIPVSEAFNQYQNAKAALAHHKFGNVYEAQFTAAFTGLLDAMETTTLGDLRRSVPVSGNKDSFLMTPAEAGGQVPVDAWLLEQARAWGLSVSGSELVLNDITSLTPEERPLMDLLQKVRTSVLDGAKEQGGSQGAVGTPDDTLARLRAGAALDTADLNKAYSASSSAKLLDGTIATDTNALADLLINVQRFDPNMTLDSLKNKIRENKNDGSMDTVYQAAGEGSARLAVYSRSPLAADSFKALHTALRSDDRNQLSFAKGMLKQVGGVTGPKVLEAIRGLDQDERIDFFASATALLSNTADNGNWTSEYIRKRDSIQNTRINHNPDGSVANKDVSKMIYGESGVTATEMVRKTLSQMIPGIDKKALPDMDLDLLRGLEETAYNMAQDRSFESPGELWTTALQLMQSNGLRFTQEKLGDTPVIRAIVDPVGHYVSDPAGKTAPDVYVDRFVNERMSTVVPSGTAMETQLRQYFAVPEGTDTKGWRTWDYVKHGIPDLLYNKNLEDVQFSVSYTKDDAPYYMQRDYVYRPGEPDPKDPRRTLSLDTTWLGGGGVVMISSRDPRGEMKQISIRGVGAEAKRGPFQLSQKRLTADGPIGGTKQMTAPVVPTSEQKLLGRLTEGYENKPITMK